MTKISVIIPIYNVELYLRKCIDSIVSQSFPNFEVILVNDGSTDNSGCIADEYKDNDKRITVIHKENGGVSSARNAGLSNAKGDYVWFVDGDDWIEPNALENLWDEIENLDVDMVIFGNTRVDNNKKIRKILSLENYGLYTFEISDFYENYYFSNKVGFMPWNKIYKREVIQANKITFDSEEAFGEDLLFNLYYYLNIKNIYFSKGVYYNYYVRAGSAERTSSKVRHIQQMRLYEKFINYVNKKELSQEIKNEILPSLFLIHLISGLNQSKLSGIKVKEIVPFLRNIKEEKYFCNVFKEVSLFTTINRWLEIENASLISRSKYNLIMFFFTRKKYYIAALILFC